MSLFAFRPPCPVECAAYSSGVSGKQKTTKPQRPLRLCGELLQHRFAKKRYDYEYRWTPAKETEAAILKAIFGQG